MKYLIVFAFALIINAPGYSQNSKDNSNLVKNPGFEELTDDLRRDESFGLVKNWANGGKLEADVFSAAIEDDDVSAPKNYRGIQEPREGNNYAGIYAYYFKSEEPRTYINTELSDKLEEDQLYCVKMSVSLAELSRYAVNNVGFVLSKHNESDDQDILRLENYQTSDRNKVIKEKTGWFDICSTVQAEGGEDNLIIGNFESDRRTRKEKMPPVKGDYEDPQMPMAYYYVDDVSVTPISRGSECRCNNRGGIPVNKLVYSSTTPITKEMNMTQKLEANTVYFQQYKAELRPQAKKHLDNVISYMEDNPAMEVKIIGHSDKKEVKLAKKKQQLKGLAQMRIDKVKEYIIDNGIRRARLQTEAMDDTMPASPMETPISLSRNRRVAFKPVLK